VVQGGKAVGVAFQAVADLQGVGYFIPTEVIAHFLTDAADGRYDGYPDLGIQVAALDNPAERRREGLPEGVTGVRVEIIWPSGSAYGHLQLGDLVVGFEGRPIANDGSVLDGPSRIPFGLLVDRRQAGETVTLQVLRGGKKLDVPVPLATFAPAVFRSNAFDRLPRYYVYGGLVFVPLELETMKTFGREWYARADRALLHEFLFRPLLEPALLARERVVLLRRLDHPVNADMAWFRNLAVERVNGKRILGLEDLIAAIESNTDPFHVIEFSNMHRLGVLDRAAADAAQKEILARYGVPRDRRL